MPAVMQIPSLIGGATALVRTANDAHKEAWPYPYKYCPPNGKHFDMAAAAAAPANATQTLLWTYTVPDGYQLAITETVLTYSGTPMVDGQGLVSWQWDVNIPVSIGAGVTAPILPSGYIVPFFGDVDANGQPTGGSTIHRGSMDSSWKIPGRLVFAPRDVIRVKVTTTAPFPTVGVYFQTCMVGHSWPV